MSIEVRCSAGHTLKVADTWAGRGGRCPVCKALVQVPVKVQSPRSKVQGQAGEVPGSGLQVRGAELQVTDSTFQVPEARESVSEKSPISKPPPLPPPLPAIGTGVTGDALKSTQQAVHAPLNRAAVDDVVADVADARLIGAVETRDEPKPLAAQIVTETPIARDEAGASVAVEHPTTIQSDSSRDTAGLSTQRIDAGDKEQVSDSSPLALPKDKEKGPSAITPLSAPPPQGREVLKHVQDANGAAASIAQDERPTRSPAGYKPDSDKRWTVYYLGGAMAALGLYCMLPALRYWNLSSAPDWARAVLLVSLLQLAYVAWVVSIPDWATLRSSMIFFTILAALYGATMTIALTTPPEENVLLELTDVRRQAPLWCASVVLLSFLLAYFCGHAAWRWRRMFELMHAQG